MEEEKNLYPLNFCTDVDEYSWGTEEFLLADLGYKDSLIREGWLGGNSISEIMDTYVDKLVGDNVYDFFGRQFPVCLKNLKINGFMPLKVSPDDELASDRYNFLGKERLWYISKSSKGAKLYIGFASDCNAKYLYDKCLDNSVIELLNEIETKEGCYYFIPSGVPYCASGDLEIFEISESSPLDFTLWNWGNEIEGDDFDKSLNLEEALDFINYKAFSSPKLKEDTIISLPQFIVKNINLTTGLHSETKEGSESFVIYHCINGEAVVQIEVYGQNSNYKLKLGDTVLVPAECTSFNLLPVQTNTNLLEISVIALNNDKYLNNET